jgi:hypothetical protein
MLLYCVGTCAAGRFLTGAVLMGALCYSLFFKSSASA